MAKKEKEKIAFSRGLRNSAMLIRYTAKYSPKFLFHTMWNSVIVGIMNILNSIVIMRVIFNMIERRDPFYQVAWFIVAMMVLLMAIEFQRAIYNDYLKFSGYAKLKKPINTEFFNKVLKIDLSQYDNPEFYSRFIGAIKDVDLRIRATTNSLKSVVIRLITGIGVVSILATIDTAALLLAVISLIFIMIFKTFAARLEYEREMETIPLRKKTDYVSRVFNLPEFAKELRIC